MMESEIKRSAKRTATKTARKARVAAANPWLELAERLGYAIRGLLYAVMGLLALGMVLGRGGKATDQKGSLLWLIDNPLGRPLLAVFITGLIAYSVWGGVRAVFDPLRRGSDPMGIAERLGFAWSGFAYGVLAIFALQLLASGTGPPGDSDSTPALVAAILTKPAGRWLTGLAGLLGIAVGLGQFLEAYRAGFRRDLKRGEMTKAAKTAADWLGRWGMLSRGITFSLVGWFLVVAALLQNPGEAQGFGGAFLFIVQLPMGRLLLALVALGFIALGLYSLAAARWMRLLGD